VNLTHQIQSGLLQRLLSGVGCWLLFSQQQDAIRLTGVELQRQFSLKFCMKRLVLSGGEEHGAIHMVVVPQMG